MAVVVLVSAVGLLALRVSTAGQFQDPALSGDTGVPQPSPTATP